MSDQLRKPKDIVGRQEDSAFKMSKETEQRLIREFQSPFPKETIGRPETALTQNSCWNRTHG